jgi:hypothetical protein
MKSKKTVKCPPPTTTAMHRLLTETHQPCSFPLRSLRSMIFLVGMTHGGCHLSSSKAKLFRKKAARVAKTADDGHHRLIKEPAIDSAEAAVLTTKPKTRMMSTRRLLLKKTSSLLR